MSLRRIMLLLFLLLLFVPVVGYGETTAKDEAVVLHGVWEFSHAVNIDGENCSPEECGGNRTIYLMENGYGFVASPKEFRA